MAEKHNPNWEETKTIKGMLKPEAKDTNVIILKPSSKYAKIAMVTFYCKLLSIYFTRIAITI